MRRCGRGTSCLHGAVVGGQHQPPYGAEQVVHQGLALAFQHARLRQHLAGAGCAVGDQPVAQRRDQLLANQRRCLAAGLAQHARIAGAGAGKAEKLGYNPQVILAGRRINDSMGKYVAEQTVKQMIAADLPVKGADVIVLGMTFKENCPDLRNSKVIDVVNELKSFGANVHVHDPIAESAECEHEYGVKLTPWEQLPRACAIVAAVAHKEYAEMGLAKIAEKAVEKAVFADVKSAYEPAALAALGLKSWRL